MGRRSTRTRRIPLLDRMRSNFKRGCSVCCIGTQVSWERLPSRQIKSRHSVLPRRTGLRPEPTRPDCLQMPGRSAAATGRPRTQRCSSSPRGRPRFGHPGMRAVSSLRQYHSAGDATLERQPRVVALNPETETELACMLNLETEPARRGHRFSCLHRSRHRSDPRLHRRCAAAAAL